MTREEALAMLVPHNSQRRMFLGETGTSEALDLAIAALREQPKNESADQQLDALIDELDEGNMTLNELRERLLGWKNGLIAALREQPAPEETPNDYLDSLVKKASPAWQGVDPQQFLDEVRGRTANAIEWKPGPPTKEGKYLIAIHSWYGKDVVEMYWFVRDNPMSAEKLKKVAFHAAWPQYPDHV